MEIIGIKIGIVGFCIFMTYFSFMSYKRHYFGVAAFAAWVIIFIGMAIGTAFSEMFIPFSNFLRFARLFDLFIAIAIIFLVIISFINFIENHQLKQKLDKLVQDKALKDRD